jgi:preprotein translocase subunit SecB
MTDTAREPVIATDSYYLDAVIAQELHLQGIAETQSLPDTSLVEFSWEWTAHSATVFDVILKAEAAACKPRPENLKVLLFGRFRRTGEPKPNFKTFVTLNAVAILFPYLREAVSVLTGKGGVGAFYLNPINVEKWAATISLEASYGTRSLLDKPELATAYGIDLTEISGNAHATQEATKG